MKCLACGSESLVGGTVLDSNGSKPTFKLDDTTTWKSMLGISGRAASVPMAASTANICSLPSISPKRICGGTSSSRVSSRVCSNE
jgi:hypothetical protein